MLRSGRNPIVRQPPRNNMKMRVLFGMIALLTATVCLHAGPRDVEWKKVEEATGKGLPKTAIERLEPIIAGALADKAYAEAVKAVAEKLTLEGGVQGNESGEKIVLMRAEIEKTPAAMRPVMEAILADWYWQYYQQNRWSIMQRTQTEAAPGPDFRTWDLSRLLAEVDMHFSAALVDAHALQATPVAEFNDLLTKGTVPDGYRPTMYDFLAHEALQFYEAGEQASNASEDEYEVSAASPALDDAGAFTDWRPGSSDVESPKLKAIALYQSLLRFHLQDADRSAYFDNDLGRLGYAHNVAVGDDKEARYKDALRRFIETTSGHEISSQAIGLLARQFYIEGEPAKARVLAARGLAAFPKSIGAALCYNLIQRIDAKSVRLDTESVWNAPWPTLNVTYANVTKIYFRAVPVNFMEYISMIQSNFRYLDEDVQAWLMRKPPALEWASDLPPTPDFKQRTERLPAPQTLAYGFYCIVASSDPSFRKTDNMLGMASVWVSDLALVLRTRDVGGKQGGFVLRANSGEPVKGANVHVLERVKNSSWLEAGVGTTTDMDGRFQISAPNGSVVIFAEAEGQGVSNALESYLYQAPTPESAGAEAVFFTDRAIYRPGQTINYKGILALHDEAAGNYAVSAGADLTVVFSDSNGKEITRTDLRTNDYGSFSGVFTAPRDRMTGNMSIRLLDRQGSASIRVEEYKRPKFQAEFNAPVEAAKLGTPVTLTGAATAYTGAAIGGAKVKWRVERTAQGPYWCWWWSSPGTKAIAHGVAVTEPDGTFKVQFPAEPDRTVPEKNEPTFVFSVHADVTDSTGETRSCDRTVQAGYTALRAELTAEPWQTPEKPVAFTVGTTSLDGDPQEASGTVTLYALMQPTVVERATLQGERNRWEADAGEPKVDPANPDSWEPGEVVAVDAFTTDKDGKATIPQPLRAGVYRAALETKDRLGVKVTARCTVHVVDPAADHFAVRLPNYFSSPKWTTEPGETFTALWGTGYAKGRAFVEVECAGKPIKSYWTGPRSTQEIVSLPVVESMRGGFTVRVTYVRENRAYFNENVVDVPWSNKQLEVKWEHFRSKLMPGQEETWTAVVTAPGGRRTAAEMVAALYDASLDQYLPNDWPRSFDVFRQENSGSAEEFQNVKLDFQDVSKPELAELRADDWTYRRFRNEVDTRDEDEPTVLSPFVVDASEDKGSYRANSTLAGTRVRTDLKDVNSAIRVVTSQFLQDTGAKDAKDLLVYTPGSEIAGLALKPGDASPLPDLGKVAARRNLGETAFFFPQLVSGEDGVVKMVFTMPETLTNWKFLGFAHDRQLRAGFLTGRVVTAKDLMVEPNPPRFVREGDTLEFTVKVSNQSDHAQSGKVRLTFADAATLAPRDEALGNRAAEQPFDVPAKQSHSYSWRVAVPDGLGFLAYKAVGATALASDGEEGFLPVLSRRIQVTESLALPIRGKSTKQFDFRKLIDSGTSDTLRSQSLTVQMVSKPAWYAVMALPYLMEYPYECSEQLFNRYYANALARHIANSDPKIRRVFELWKGTAALDSPLEKNQELKSVMIEETPWLRQAASESQSRRNVGLLFDANRLNDESSRVLRQLSERQLGGGLWSWFPGGGPSDYISLYIATGFGRLRHLGVDVDLAPAIKAFGALDASMDTQYRHILSFPHAEKYVPTYSDAFYLYGRSFFLKDLPIAAQHKESMDFYLGQSRKFWVNVDSRLSQAHLAIALQRFGDKETPSAIMKSIKERSIGDGELGMYWRDGDSSWWWYRAPIETQAMMIEAFAEVANDSQAVEDCKVWLLKQKQTQDWKTTRATADAIYGLLQRGDNLLSGDTLVEVALGGKAIVPENVEAGTGFYEHRFVRDEIRPDMGRITVKKVDDGVSWGSVHWQYLEDIAKVTPHEGTPLHLKKALFIKETTAKGQVLRAVTGPLSVGDELVVRIELRTDRDMEFVQLKDQRGSGTEPVNVLSGYKYQDGLAYYESTRDTASDFFIDFLPKGTYVFEYSVRVQLRGTYQTGIAQIQCMYAPEFNSHSESFALEVR
jgi:hypothetical protein